MMTIPFVFQVLALLPVGFGLRSCTTCTLPHPRAPSQDSKSFGYKSVAPRSPDLIVGAKPVSPKEQQRPLIVLDRDGVINHDSPDYIKSLSEWQPIPGSLEAIAKLNQAGWIVAIATNQSALSRGLTTLADVACIHEQLQTKLAALGGKIDAIALCPHLPEHHCPCRKPKPGLLLELAHEFHYQPKDIIVVGDSLRDIEAAEALGAKSYWVKTGKPLPEKITTTAVILPSLADVVQDLLRT